MHQDWREGDGGSADQTSRGKITNNGQSELVPQPFTKTRTCGCHQRHGDKGGWMTLRRGRAGGGRRSEPSSLDNAFRSQKCRHFYLFVASGNGLLGVEATDNLKRLDIYLATKWRQPYTRTSRYVKSRITITLVRATHRCIRGSMMTAHRIIIQRL